MNRSPRRAAPVYHFIIRIARRARRESTPCAHRRGPGARLLHLGCDPRSLASGRLRCRSCHEAIVAPIITPLRTNHRTRRVHPQTPNLVFPSSELQLKHCNSDWAREKHRVSRRRPASPPGLFGDSIAQATLPLLGYAYQRGPWWGPLSGVCRSSLRSALNACGDRISTMAPFRWGVDGAAVRSYAVAKPARLLPPAAKPEPTRENAIGLSELSIQGI